MCPSWTVTSTRSFANRVSRADVEPAHDAERELLQHDAGPHPPDRRRADRPSQRRGHERARAEPDRAEVALDGGHEEALDVELRVEEHHPDDVDELADRDGREHHLRAAA